MTGLMSDSPLYSVAQSQCWWDSTRGFLFTQTPDLELTPESGQHMCSLLTPGVSEVGKESNPPRPSRFSFCTSGAGGAPTASAAGWLATHTWCAGHTAPTPACHTAGLSLCCCCTRRRCSGGGGLGRRDHLRELLHVGWLDVHDIWHRRVKEGTTGRGASAGTKHRCFI